MSKKQQQKTAPVRKATTAKAGKRSGHTSVKAHCNRTSTPDFLAGLIKPTMTTEVNPNTFDVKAWKAAEENMTAIARRVNAGWLNS